MQQVRGTGKGTLRTVFKLWKDIARNLRRDGNTNMMGTLGEVSWRDLEQLLTSVMKNAPISIPLGIEPGFLPCHSDALKRVYCGS